MENSFSRSKQLNSRIQKAEDSFYSVPRGNNREIAIDNLEVINSISEPHYDFDLITNASTGKYKLFAKGIWTFNQNTIIDHLEGYLALNSVVRTINGNNKLYLDVGEQQDNGYIIADSNISEQIVVYQKYAEYANNRFRINNSYYEKVPLYKDLTEFWQSSEPNALCAITTTNYGVRLWSKNIIPTSTSYEIRYLSCPDRNAVLVETAKAIKSIPNCRIGENTSITTISDTEYRLEDKDQIYLNASNNVRSKGVVKSIKDLEVKLPQCFPEFKSYRMLVGPYGGESQDTAATDDTTYLQNIVSITQGYEATIDKPPTLVTPNVIKYVPSGSIYVWYTLDIAPKTNSDGEYIRDFTQLNEEHLSLWNKLVKAYYIPSNTNIFFKNTNELLIDENVSSDLPSEHIKVLDDYKISIYYSGNIDYQAIESILDKYQLLIGEDFNPYKIMSDISTNANLYGIVKYVVIEQHVNGQYQPAGIVKISKDQRFWFKQKYNDLIKYVKE